MGMRADDLAELLWLGRLIEEQVDYGSTQGQEVEHSG